MEGSFRILSPIFFPILSGLIILCLPEFNKRKNLILWTGISLFITIILVLECLTTPELECTMFFLTDTLPIYFHLDNTGRLFAGVTTIVWILTGFYSFDYMRREHKEKRYFGFYLIVFGVLMGLDFAGNLVTYYMLYELMTLTSLPMVLHKQTKEAIMAGLKYLFYSLFGAYMVLFGFYFLYRFTNTLTFTPGGTLDMELVKGHEGLLLIVAFLMILGFSVKAGMFPLHAWLPIVHPIAPTPASAVLSGIIVKAGVLGIIRVIFYLFGADFIRGTWVQTVWLLLSVITIFMGSMLAYREKILKKRLAYSTVSNLSYILFGLALLNPAGMTGALLHVVFHACIKVVLFLIAGEIIYETGITRVDGLKGIGKQMPVSIWCFTIASLGLIGIPPIGGFFSKWYLLNGSLQAQNSGLAIIGAVVLLLSALLTAGYLLPITIQGFFPGKDYDYSTLQKKEPGFHMLIPVILITGLVVLFGMFPNGILNIINQIVSELM